MSLCTLQNNLTKDAFCGYSLKQIVEIYLAEYGTINAKAGTGTSSSDYDAYEVTAITATKGDSMTWYKVQPAKDTASYNDDLVIGGNGSKYRTHQLTFSFNGAYNTDLAKALDALSLGKYVAILKLSDGSYVMLGRLTGLEASAASSLSEAAADGQNGITVTLEGNVTEPALPVKSEVFDSAVAANVSE